MSILKRNQPHRWPKFEQTAIKLLTAIPGLLAITVMIFPELFESRRYGSESWVARNQVISVAALVLVAVSPWIWVCVKRCASYSDLFLGKESAALRLGEQRCQTEALEARLIETARALTDSQDIEVRLEEKVAQNSGAIRKLASNNKNLVITIRRMAGLLDAATFAQVVSCNHVEGEYMLSIEGHMHLALDTGDICVLANKRTLLPVGIADVEFDEITGTQHLKVQDVFDELWWEQSIDEANRHLKTQSEIVVISVSKKGDIK